MAVTHGGERSIAAPGDEDVRSVVEACGLARDLGFDDLQGAGLAADARQLGLLVRAAGGAEAALAWLFATAAAVERAGDAQTAKVILGVVVRVRLLASRP